MSVRKRAWTSPNGEKKTGWEVSYSVNGKRHRKLFDLKKPADAFHLRARGEVNAGTHTPDSVSVTVAEAGARWLEHCVARGIERSTITAYRQHLALHIAPYLGGVKLSALTLPMVPEFQDRLRADGSSPAMIRKSRVALGAILKFAQKRGLVGQNVVRSLGRDDDHATDRAAKRPLEIGVDIPSRDEIRAIESKLPGTRYRALLTTAFTTGLRASELRGLRWADVDLKRGELHVRQRADRYNRIGRPKSSAGTRSIPLMPMVVAVLREHKLATPANALDLVFPNRKGKVDHLVTIAAGWRAAQEKAGVVGPDRTAKYSGLHAIRHFYASWCINRIADGGLELPMKVVQGRLGHATISMTADVYGHLFPTADHSSEMATAQRAWLA